MHELSLAVAMMRQVNEVAAREDIHRVTRIEIVIGALSGVEREAFEFAYPVAIEGTVAHGAELVLIEEPLKVRCLACGEETEPEFPMVYCTACHCTRVDEIAGLDFVLRSMEVE